MDTQKGIGIAQLGSGALDLRQLFGRKPRVVIGHPYLGRGGSEARVMWLIEALKPDCDLTVVTTGGWDLQALNRAYGTQVEAQDAEVRLAPFPRLLQRYPLAMLRWAYYQRFCRQIADQFDARITAYNCTDWGLPAIQFIADFAWDPASREIEGGRPPGWFYRDTPLRRTYLAWARRVMQPSGRDSFREDLLVPTSEWAGRILRDRWQAHHVAPLYPFSHFSVPESFRRRVDEHGDLGFLSLSRIAPEKRIEDVIEILRLVRKRGYPAKLCLAGGIPQDCYGELIRRLVLAEKDWISPTGYCEGEEKLSLLSKCDFGISVRRQEMFGNAVVEMVRAGLIVFAWADGGPAEILAHNALLFKNNEEAANKICRVLEDRRLRQELRTHLRERAKLFSLNTTIRRVRSLVAFHLAGALTDLDHVF
jgi:glycosyltransferase involved in cell wall biosynthesis